MSSPTPLEPRTWYSATVSCRTADCPNLDKILDVPWLYSNDGLYYAVICGLCGARTEILTTTKLNPQPIEE